MDQLKLKHAYDELAQEAACLAGKLADIPQRAAIYHHVYYASGGNHAFPLIAAHGALWARGYFRLGMRLGRMLSWPHAFRPGRRTELLQALSVFADVFREVNRRVCVDTYTTFHFTARFGDLPEAERFVPSGLLAALNSVHAARRAGRSMTGEEKRRVFHTFLQNEQRTVVGPSIEKAVAAFAWPLLKYIALKPLIRFAYFPAQQTIWFRNFADLDERIRNGLKAFDTAERTGWARVEATLANYCVLPEAFFIEPGDYFARLRRSLLFAVHGSHW